MKKLIIIAWFVFMATPATSAPHPGKKAFAYYSCNQCHSAGSLAISAAQITAKYQGQQGAYGYLLSEFKKGTFDKTGNRHLSLSKEMTDKQMENVMEWLVGNRDTSAFTASQDNSSAKVEKNTGTSTSKAETSSGAAVLGAIGAVAGVYLENQEAKSNSRSRNSRPSQPAAQARTQTSQNNYPSSSSDNDSYSTSNSQTSSTNSKRLDNPAALVNECISIKSGGGGLKNNCGFTVHYSYCTLNGINNPINKCEQNGLGTAGMGSYKDDGYSGLAGDKINWFACKAPSMPKQTNYDYQQKVITGYCSN